MNCQTCLDAINRELDGGHTAKIHEHVLVCASCRSLCQAAEQLRRGLAQLSAPMPAAVLTEAIVGRVLADRRARRRSHLLGYSLALAAAVILGVGTVLFWPSGPRLPMDGPLPQAKSMQPPERVESALTLRDSVTEAGSAVVSLTTRTADETVGQTRLLLPVVTGPVLEDFELAGSWDAVSLREAGRGLSAGLEPVTDSARRAVGLFLRDLTPADAEGKPGL